MRVGIYNRWLKTRGGGERYALSVAAHLAKQHSVEVLMHEPIDRQALASTLGLDLDGVDVRCVPDGQDPEITTYTADYDLFINGTFMSTLASAASRSAMLVYFPRRLVERRRGHWIGRGYGLARRLMGVPQFVSGFYPPERGRERRFRWARRHARIRFGIPPSRTPIGVHLVMGRGLPADSEPRRVRVLSEGREVGEFVVPSPGNDFDACEVTVEAAGRQWVELDLVCDASGTAERRNSDRRELGVAVSDVRLTHPLHRLYRVLARTCPAVARPLHLADAPVDFLRTYHTIIAISEYSRAWVHRYWKRESRVLYPPVAVERLGSGPKRNTILSVGRFFPGGHDKKHVVLVKAFKRLVDAGLRDWELHLAGNVSDDPTHRRHLESIRAEAAGYPIGLYPNATLDQLRQLYAAAAIYWHACGYGEEEHLHPDRLEHFGITTVEAMAAGCVPVVIGTGGQREIVEDGVSGLLWCSLSELDDLTRKVIDDTRLASRLRSGAVARAHAFSQAEFAGRLDAILADEVLGVSRTGPASSAAFGAGATVRRRAAP